MITTNDFWNELDKTLAKAAADMSVYCRGGNFTFEVFGEPPRHIEVIT
jgi:hypothetical protein